VLRRSLVTRTVDAGMGRWLAGDDPSQLQVIVDPKVERGRFRGWVVRKLYPEDPCYREVDVRPGDVVVKVNGRSVERPEHADTVWKSLRTAPALTVELLRDGRPITVTLPIADE
jgi:type II secretory pathway component PulC